MSEAGWGGEFGLRGPGGTAGDFPKSQLLIEFDGAQVVVADVKPERGGLFVPAVFHGALGEDAGDTAAAIFGMRGDVGNEMDAPALVAERDDAGVANDAPILLPDKSCQRQGGCLRHVRCPLQEAVVMAGRRMSAM